jgi:hypothetical protein
MNADRRYGSGPALRTGLEETLKGMSREEIYRFAEASPSGGVRPFSRASLPFARQRLGAEGGYAMESRFQTARSTKDLDFTVRTAPAGVGDTILAFLQDVGAVDAGDYFSFRVSEATMDLDGAPSEGRDIRSKPLKLPTPAIGWGSQVLNRQPSP